MSNSSPNPFLFLFPQGTRFNGGGNTDRGANTAVEFDRQRAKIINAIVAISPDVLGLTEVREQAVSVCLLSFPKQ